MDEFLELTAATFQYYLTRTVYSILHVSGVHGRIHAWRVKHWPQQAHG